MLGTGSPKSNYLHTSEEVDRSCIDEDTEHDEIHTMASVGARTLKLCNTFPSGAVNIEIYNIRRRSLMVKAGFS